MLGSVAGRTANGSTGANQLLGQIETGYRIGLYTPAAASVTPFARLQGWTVTQKAFSEWRRFLEPQRGAQQRARPRTRPAAGLAARIRQRLHRLWRDAAVIGFSAGTTVAEAIQLSLRYDGEISTGPNNHTLNLGLRISW